MDDYQSPAPQTGGPPGAVNTLDDIDALLRSAGLAPLGRHGAAAGIEPEPQQAQTKNFTPVSSGAKATGDTKHFDLKPPKAPAPPKYAPDDGQLLLEGYEDADAPVRMDEAVVEAHLKHKRKNLVESFRVFSSDEEDNAILEKDATGTGATSVFDSLELKEGEAVFDAVARADKDENDHKSAFAKRLSRPRRELKERSEQKRAALLDVKTTRENLSERTAVARRNAGAQLALFAGAMLLSLMIPVYVDHGRLSLLYGYGARGYTVLNLLILAGSAFFAADAIKAALAHLRERFLTTRALTLLLGMLAVLHALVSLVLPLQGAEIVSFVPCAVFAFFLLDATQFVQAVALRNDLSAMTRVKQLQGLLAVEQGPDADVIGHGITKKMNPNILYTADAALPEEYDALLAQDDSHAPLLRWGSLAAAGAAFVFAVVNAVLQKGAGFFLPTLVSGAFLLSPYCCDAISVLLKMRSDARLAGVSVIVPNAQAASQVGAADAVILDSDDIFTARVTRFKTVPNGRMSTQDAALYAAATLHGTRSLICGEFDAFLADANVAVPEAEDLQYEDRLGYSCWVAGRRILVGNRDMLVQHSIPAPTAEEERAYAKDRDVLYVAVEGLVAATFMVQYHVRKEVRGLVRLFNKAGLVLMLNSGDPCLTEESAAKTLALDVAAIKIMNSKSVGIIQAHRASAEPRTAALLCAKEQNGVLRLVHAAHGLFEAEKLAGILHITGLALCLLVMVLCIVMKLTPFFMPVTVVFLQLAWSLIAYFIGSLRL